MNEEPEIKKALVQASVRISLIGGSNYYFRYSNRKRAHAICKAIVDRMVRLANGDTTILPIFSTNILFEEGVEWDKKMVSKSKGDLQTELGWGYVEYQQAAFRLDQIAGIAVVCPACGTTILDTMKSHYVLQDGSCLDPTMDGSP